MQATGDLTLQERKPLQGDSWGISGIVLWEIAKLAQLGRIDLDLGDQEVIRVLSAVHVWPITEDIAHAVARLDVQELASMIFPYYA